ncbi:MAG: hypothetical protein HQL60_08470, partial [Magnetococcales bacterium]|nr:hypothetical protein [Magnetococcales bacterium]
MNGKNRGGGSPQQANGRFKPASVAGATAAAAKPADQNSGGDNPIANNLDAVLQQQLNDKLGMKPKVDETVVTAGAAAVADSSDDKKVDEVASSVAVAADAAPAEDKKVDDATVDAIKPDEASKADVITPVVVVADAAPVEEKSDDKKADDAAVDAVKADEVKADEVKGDEASKVDVITPVAVVADAAPAEDKKVDDATIDAAKPDPVKADEASKVDVITPAVVVTDSTPAAVTSVPPVPLADLPEAGADKSEDKKVVDADKQGETKDDAPKAVDAAPAAVASVPTPQKVNLSAWTPRPLKPVVAVEKDEKKPADEAKKDEAKKDEANIAPSLPTPPKVNLSAWTPRPFGTSPLGTLSGSTDKGEDKKVVEAEKPVASPIPALTPFAATSDAAKEIAKDTPAASEEMTFAAPVRKDAFVAAAEKERVLKAIRDAASKRVEDALEIRALKAAHQQHQ